jgi:hypothetical protein
VVLPARLNQTGSATTPTLSSHDSQACQSSNAAFGVSTEGAQRIVAEAGRRYFEGRRSRVVGFVDRHFSLAGSAAIHRKAVGWDMLKAPANIALAVPQLATKLAAAGAKAVGAERASALLGSRSLMFDTAVGEEIEWLIITDLLELPFRRGEREARRDALTEVILSARELQQTLNDTLAAIERHGDDPAFRQRLVAAIETYVGTRAAAEITTAMLTVGAGAVAVKQATLGVMTLGPALAAALAQQAAGSPPFRSEPAWAACGTGSSRRPPLRSWSAA